MANHHGRQNVWTPQHWNDIDQAVRTDVGRVRIAQKVFDSQQKAGQDSVQADILTLSDIPGAPLMIQEGMTLPFLEISAKFALTESQMMNEDFLHSAQTLAQLSARKIALAEDLYFFQGANASFPEGIEVSNSNQKWQGLLNMEGMSQEISVEALKSGHYGENTFMAVSQGIAQLTSAGHPGPYALILQTNLFADTHAPVSNTLVTTADRINPLVEGRFYSTGTLPPFTGLLVSLGGVPATIYYEQDITTVYNNEDAFGKHRFRILERVQVIVREPQAFVRLNFGADQ